MSTSPFANATTNITISNNGTVLAAVFNSSVGMVSILNLVESQLSTVAITFIPVALPTRLDIGNITLTVTGNPSTSAFLPTMTLPPSASLPIFGSATPTPTPTPVKAASNHHTLVIEADSLLALPLSRLWAICVGDASGGDVHQQTLTVKGRSQCIPGPQNKHGI
ncbi:hypothetical protein H0H93_010504 [Arthromyces matolae]|nr:hypothetical protein H0H93_010504 [Arthromyces matolae]